MKILTKQIEQAFEKQGATGDMELSDIKVLMKIFNPSGGQTWWLYERLDDDIFMAFVNLGDPEMAECGTVSLSELKSIRVKPYGLKLERDLYWNQKTTLQQVIEQVKN